MQKRKEREKERKVREKKRKEDQVKKKKKALQVQSQYDILSYQSKKTRKQLQGSLSLRRHSIDLRKGHSTKQYEISEDMKVLIAKNNPSITCLVLPDGKREPVLFQNPKMAKDFSRKFRTIKRRLSSRSLIFEKQLSKHKKIEKSSSNSSTKSSNSNKSLKKKRRIKEEIPLISNSDE
eukprot:Anaeramoba_flamelloidesa817637_39.p1 GENE.a817637_39~~a817637_39.p1  ORF type:complete len:178 (-),score=53.36 a817637_39:67-600(-)